MSTVKSPSRFQTVKTLGHGAFGRADHVIETSTGREFALKTSSVANPNMRATALREISLLKALVHPNVVKIHEEWEDREKHMLVLLELCDGSLSDLILEGKSAGRLYDERYILFIFAQICAALHFVHSKGIMHRDIKSANILYIRAAPEDEPLIKLADFGVSRPLGDLSVAYSVVGTMNSLSPEILNGKPYNKKTDMWSLGCVLYELATYYPAFGGPKQSMTVIIEGVSSGSYTPLPPCFSPEFHALLASLLQVEAASRPDTSELIALPIMQRAFTDISEGQSCSRFSDFPWTLTEEVKEVPEDLGPGWGTISSPMSLTASISASEVSGLAISEESVNENVDRMADRLAARSRLLAANSSGGRVDPPSK